MVCQIKKADASAFLICLKRVKRCLNKGKNEQKVSKLLDALFLFVQPAICFFKPLYNKVTEKYIIDIRYFTWDIKKSNRHRNAENCFVFILSDLNNLNVGIALSMENHPLT